MLSVVFNSKYSLFTIQSHIQSLDVVKSNVIWNLYCIAYVTSCESSMNSCKYFVQSCNFPWVVKSSWSWCNEPLDSMKDRTFLTVGFSRRSLLHAVIQVILREQMVLKEGLLAVRVCCFRCRVLCIIHIFLVYLWI
jgi:hypothetical protein